MSGREAVAERELALELPAFFRDKVEEALGRDKSFPFAPGRAEVRRTTV
jgi:hypothetical protein